MDEQGFDSEGRWLALATVTTILGATLVAISELLHLIFERHFGFENVPWLVNLWFCISALGPLGLWLVAITWMQSYPPLATGLIVVVGLVAVCISLACVSLVIFFGYGATAFEHAGIFTNLILRFGLAGVIAPLPLLAILGFVRMVIMRFV